MAVLQWKLYTQVVHGDLALRNLLLDQNQRVKITDFGLSTHLYEYANTNLANKKVCMNHTNRCIPYQKFKNMHDCISLVPG